MSPQECHHSQDLLPALPNNAIRTLRAVAPCYGTIKKTIVRSFSRFQPLSELSYNGFEALNFHPQSSSNQFSSVDGSNSHGQSLQPFDKPRISKHLSAPLLSQQSTSLRKRRPLSWFPSTRTYSQARFHNNHSNISQNSPQLLLATEGTHSGDGPTGFIENRATCLDDTRCLWKPASVSCQPEKLSVSNVTASLPRTKSASSFRCSSDRRAKRFSLGSIVSNIDEKICKSQSVGQNVSFHLQGPDTLNDIMCQSYVEDDISRRNAEVINLYQEKIHQLTGYGRIKRKSVNNSSGEAGHIIVSSPRAGPTWLRGPLYHSAQSDSQTQLLLDSPDCVADLRHGSMTRSFERAVESFNLQTSSESICNMGLLRSSKSWFSLKANAEDKEDESSTKDNISQKAEKEKGYASCESFKRAVDLKVPCPVTPSRPHGSKTGLYDDETARSDTYLVRTTGTHPLRMHPNTTAFAPVPPHLSGLPTPGSVEFKSTKPADDEDQVDIDDATLYNEISGNLTYYSRRTPLTPATLLGVGRDESLATIDTPTKKPSKGRAIVKRGLQKTKTMFNLKERIRGKGKEGTEEKVMKRQAQTEGGTSRTRRVCKDQISAPRPCQVAHQPITPSPLRQEHEQTLNSPIILRTTQSGTREEKERKHRGGYGSMDIFPASPNPKRSSV